MIDEMTHVNERADDLITMGTVGVGGTIAGKGSERLNQAQKRQKYVATYANANINKIEC